jgi:hypothetical protein
MDYVFDLNNKNWPTQDEAHVEADQIKVTMCEYGFKAVTQGAQGLGRAILAGSSYCVQLPAQIVDASALVVRFVRANDLSCKKE